MPIDVNEKTPLNLLSVPNVNGLGIKELSTILTVRRLLDSRQRRSNFGTYLMIKSNNQDSS